MSNSSSKRQRSNTNGDATTPSMDFTPIISLLPSATIRALLLDAAQAHPDIARAIVSSHADILAAERAKVVDFDPYSKNAWYELNVRYDKLSGSQQYDVAHEVEDSITGIIKSISRQTPDHACFSTKRSAMETLRKIGKTICLGNGCIGHEVHKGFQYNSCLEDAMLRIVEGMSEEERDDLVCEAADGEFLDKMVELGALKKGYCLFEGLDAVVALLEGVSDGDEDGEEDDEEEEESALDEESPESPHEG